MKLLALLSTLILTSVAFAQPKLSDTPKTLPPGKTVIDASKQFQEFKGPGQARYFKQKVLLRVGDKVFERGYLTYVCGQDGKNCDADAFISQGLFENCKQSGSSYSCKRLKDRPTYGSGGGSYSEGPNGAFEEHDHRTQPGYSSGNAGNPGPFDERARHHLDEPRAAGNEIDGWETFAI